MGERSATCRLAAEHAVQRTRPAGRRAPLNRNVMCLMKHFCFSYWFVLSMALAIYANVDAEPVAQPAVNDRVLLRATHHLGIPVHNLPQGTQDFRRVPDGTTGKVTQIQPNNKMNLDGEGIGWVNRKYIAQVLQPSTPPLDEREADIWTSPAQCASALAAGARMEKPANSVRLVTRNIRWFPKGCSPSESCEENATDLDWAACTVAWMQADVISLQEIAQ